MWNQKNKLCAVAFYAGNSQLSQSCHHSHNMSLCDYFFSSADNFSIYTFFLTYIQEEIISKWSENSIFIKKGMHVP